MTATEHLWCWGCGEQPTVARINSELRIVCHCSHVDGEVDPVPPGEMELAPGRWEFVEHASEVPET